MASLAGILIGTVIGTVLMILLLQWILKKVTNLDEIIRLCLASLAFIPIAAVISSYGNGTGELELVINGLFLYGLSAAIVTPFLIMRAHEKPKSQDDSIISDSQ